jgi:hypothetical protein
MDIALYERLDNTTSHRTPLQELVKFTECILEVSLKKAREVLKKTY